MLPPVATPEKVLAPGRLVEVPGFCKAKVYAIGPRHLKKYGKEVGQAMAALIQIAIKPGVDVKIQLIMQMVPWVMSNCLDLVEECTKLQDPAVTWDALPHWALPEIIRAWLLENFDEEYKWGPWVAVAEQALKSVTGRTVEISETLSKLSSLLDTTSGTSSTVEPPTILTKDGPSPKSASGSSASAAPRP